MASHPAFDANQLDRLGPTLSRQTDTPLLNRAAQGTYQVQNALLPMITAARLDSPEMGISSIYRSLGLVTAPEIRLAVGAPFTGTGITDARVSPLQMAVAAASISNGGIRPAPRIALAVRSPLQGWVVLPQLGELRPCLFLGGGPTGPPWATGPTTPLSGSGTAPSHRLARQSPGTWPGRSPAGRVRRWSLLCCWRTARRGSQDRLVQTCSRTPPLPEAVVMLAPGFLLSSLAGEFLSRRILLDIDRLAFKTVLCRQSSQSPCRRSVLSGKN